jgi:hypothetical protein
VNGEDSDRGAGTGCIVGLIVGLVLLVVLAVVAGAAFYWLRARRATPMRGAPRPPVRAPSAVVPRASAQQAGTPAKAATVTVKLTGTGEGGTWYTVDQDIYEGDAALREAMRELVADAKKRGGKLWVKLEVVPDAGVTPKALEAARGICAEAGAGIAPSDAEEGKK